ncbi:MAG: hypothetical protein WAU82_05820 [Candidatus Binatus sp.]|uniref:hypothetical protein n=1 Tax=Candidatus Binatus sp. TaxID=2811406 RepID=UPI003BAF85E1
MPYPAARLLATVAVALALSALQGCTDMAPQYGAQNYAPSYYEGGYSTLTPQQKFQLEDHLSNQSNQAWQTTAQVMSGAGRLLGGTGSLIGAIRSIDKPTAVARVHPPRISRRFAVR